MGHKNSEGAKRSTKVLRFRGKSENSKIGTVGPCFSPESDFLVIFSPKMRISLGNDYNFRDFPLVWMEVLQMGYKIARASKDAQTCIFFKGGEFDLCPFSLVAACKRTSYLF